MTLIYLGIAWVCGILFAEYGDPEPVVALLLMVISGFGIWQLRDHANGRLLFLACFVAGLGILRLLVAQPENQSDHVSRLNDIGPTAIQGRVISAPEATDGGLRFIMRAEEAAGRQATGQVLVDATRYANIRYGDDVRLFGTPRTPPQLDDFNYRDYLARERVFSIVYNAEAEVITNGDARSVRGALLDVRNDAREAIQRTLSEPYSALLTGILLGDESGISPTTREDFQRTGTAHIVAISGFNMAILAQLILSLLKNIMPLWPATLVALATIAVYTVFVGAGASVVRAALMSGLLIYGQALGRPTYIPTSLAGAALVMSLLDPWVLWDISFQLSFAAVMGLALFVPPIQRAVQNRLNRLQSPLVKRILFGLGDIIVVTLAAQIATLPLTLGYFGRLSLVALPANILILPVQPAILVLGGLGVLLGFVWSPGGALLVESAGLALRYTVEIIQGFAALSWADAGLVWPMSAVMLFYASLIALAIYQATRPPWLLAWLRRRRLPLRGLQIAGGIVALLLFSAAWRAPENDLRADFFEDGPGVLLQSPQGASLLIDGGPFPSRLLDALGAALPPNTGRIDVIIVTHPHPDHSGALAEVVTRYEIGALVVPDTEDSTPEYAALLDRAAERQVPIVTLQDDYTFTTGDGLGVQAIVSEDAAPVLRAQYRNAVLLLNVAPSLELEDTLLGQPHLAQSTFLHIVPGPGQAAPDALTRRFLGVNAAQAAMLQLDATAPPNPTLIARLNGQNIDFWRTDEHGAVRVHSDGERLNIYAEN